MQFDFYKFLLFFPGTKGGSCVISLLACFLPFLTKWCVSYCGQTMQHCSLNYNCFYNYFLKTFLWLPGHVFHHRFCSHVSKIASCPRAIKSSSSATEVACWLKFHPLYCRSFTQFYCSSTIRAWQQLILKFGSVRFSLKRGWHSGTCIKQPSCRYCPSTVFSAKNSLLTKISVISLRASFDFYC